MTGQDRGKIDNIACLLYNYNCRYDTQVIQREAMICEIKLVEFIKLKIK